MKRLIFFSLIAVWASMALAHDFEVNGIYYIKNSDGNTVSVSYEGTSYDQYSNEYSGSVNIPPSVTYSGETYSVTSIGNRAFFYCSRLTSVTIPNSVKTISDYAFQGCSGLMSVTIPNSVTSIGQNAFQNCGGLTSVTIPNSVTSIGNYAFSGCSGLTKVEISDLAAWCKISHGGSYANPLYYAKHLYLNGSEIKDLVIPNSVTSIGKYAFFGCSGLTSVTIGNSVTSIGSRAFSGCSGLKTVNWNAKNCANFSSESTPFHYYESGGIVHTLTGITTFNFGNEVEKIPSYLCCLLSGLTSVTIPNSVTSIGACAFASCSGLTSVSIPNSVTSIGSSAFGGTAWYNNQPDGLVYAGKVAYKYKGTMSSGTSIAINEGTVSISPYCFQNCSGLTSITIPSSVTSIGSGAFYGTAWYNNQPDGLVYINNMAYTYKGTMSSGTSIAINEGTVSISPDCFYNCSGLTSVTIPNSVTSIGQSAFEGTAWYNNQPAGLIYAGRVAYKYKGTMSSGTSIAINEGTVSISPYCFSGYRNLTSVTIPNSVTEIGDNAFSGCNNIENLAWNVKNCTSNGNMPTSNITTVSIGDGVETLPNYFVRDSKITSVTIPNSVTSIGNYAFYGCTGLSYLRIPDLTTSIGSYAFYNCSNLVAVSIGSKVKSIGSNAFSKCEKMSATFITDLDAWCNISFASKDSNPLTVSHHLYYNGAELKDMNIPENTTKIGDYAFYGMTELNSVTIPDAISSIGTEAFSGCASMKVVNSYPDASSVTLGEDVFKDVNKIMCALHVVPDFYANYCGSPQWNEFMSIIPDLEAGVEGVEVDEATKEVEGYYDLKGIRLEEPIRGQVNIVRYKDGSTKKIVN